MTDTSAKTATVDAGIPPHRYTAELANAIEAKWQDRWDADHAFEVPDLPADTSAPKSYVLDMFPYPSGAGLHVGHPLGFIGTDVLGRFQRMNGINVLHTIGFDAFGLPAEQYAVRNNIHPRTATMTNIERYRGQLRRLGFAHDRRRSVATTDVEFYRWTQWIFLQLFNSWYDRDQQRARPIDDLVGEFAAGVRQLPDGRDWAGLTDR